MFSHVFSKLDGNFNSWIRIRRLESASQMNTEPFRIHNPGY